MSFSGLGATTARVVEIPVLYSGNGLDLTIISTDGRAHAFEFRELPVKEGGEPTVLYLKSIFTLGKPACRYCGRVATTVCSVCDNDL